MGAWSVSVQKIYVIQIKRKFEIFKNIALNQEITWNNNNVNCEISLTSRVPEVSPVVLGKSSKSRDSSPMKTITFDVFDNEKPSPKPIDDKVKYIEMRKCKSSKKVAHKTLKKYTKVISFNLNNKESEEVENMPNPPQTEPDDEENKREEFKWKFSRHCRSTAPNEFLKELKNLNLNEEIVESGNTLRRRIPNK